MTGRILELVLDEGKWLFASLLVSMVTLAIVLGRQRRSGLSRRLKLLWAMNLLYAGVIGIMGSGHLLAVGLRAIQGTLEGSLALLLVLGLVLAVPAGWLAWIASRFPPDQGPVKNRLVALNLWLALSLLTLGIHNLPLAAPAALNLVYLSHRRRAVGWTVVTLATVAYAGLFVGSLVFLLSGRSFEQFSGIE